MDDELRKACERCRDFLETGVWNDLPAMPIDAAEDLMIIARHYLATTREDDGEIARPKSLEPQWLPAGTMPDAEGWWLWLERAIGKIAPIQICAENSDDFVFFLNEKDESLNFVSHCMDRGDRFAPMPMWEGPKD